MMDWLTAALILAGSLLCAVAALGLLRMPDLFTRMQSAAKAGTLGVGCIVVAAAVHFAEMGIATRALLIVVFLFATAPVAAHAIARAAYHVGVPLWERTVRDELREHLGAVAEASTSTPAPQPDSVEEPTNPSGESSAAIQEGPGHGGPAG